MRPAGLTKFLAQAFERTHKGTPMNVLVVGPPGVGKTAIIKKAAKLAKCELLISHPAVSEPVDFSGLPFADKSGKQASFLPYGMLSQALNAKKHTQWFFDDLGQALPATQAPLMQLLHGGQVNDHVLPPHVGLVAATNRREDRANVQGLLSTVLSRFKTIINLEVAVSDWVIWAYDNNIPGELIAFHKLREADGLLHQFDPAKQNAPTNGRANTPANVRAPQPKPRKDMENFPCPRTWENVADLMTLGLDDVDQHEAFCGAVGEAAAIEFSGFLRLVKELPKLDDILADPYGSVIPVKADQRYAISVGLAHRAAKKTLKPILQYGERLDAAGYGDIAYFMLKDIRHKKQDLFSTETFTDFILKSPLGKLFTGEE
jgi:hypothetical protein